MAIQLKNPIYTLTFTVNITGILGNVSTNVATQPTAGGKGIT